MRTYLILVTLLIGCGNSGNGTDANGPGDGDGTDGKVATSQGITIIVEPSTMRGAELIAAITAAKTSVYMTMYEIDNTDVINALVARKNAGLDVQAILDGSTTTKSFNTSAYNALNSAHIPCVWSNPTFTFTHEKTVIIDATTAWIMTMNANESSPADNREYLAVDTDPSDVAEATAIFNADHAMHTVSPTGNLVVANNNARPKLVQLINTATKTLDVEGEEFSDTNSNGVVDAVVQAVHRGVTVHVIIGNASPDPTSIALVKNSGGHVVVTGPTSGNGTPTNPYIHAKAILVDCVTPSTCVSGYVGSENFSAGSLGYNRELGVIFDNATELAKIKAAIDIDFAAGVVQ